MPVSAVDAINPAVQHAKQQLLQPFRFAQWIRLAVVGLLAGEAGSGGGCSFNYNFPSTQHPQGSQHFTGASWPVPTAHHPGMYIGLIAVLVVVALALFVLFTYVSSIMRFILFDSVISRECHIRKGWVRNRARGFRLFVWQILFMLGFFAATVLLVGFAALLAWRMGWFTNPAQHVLQLVLGGSVALLLLLALILVFSVVHVMTKDFVVPLMALEEISVAQGWRRLWSMLGAEKGGFGGYIGMKVVMAIAAGIVFGILSLIIFVALLVPIGGMALVAVFGGKAAGLTWTSYTIALAVIAGCSALALLFFVASLISVPTTVFFPAYSIYFFAPRYPALAGRLWPPSPVVPAPDSPPMEPPPSPPLPVPSG